MTVLENGEVIGRDPANIVVSRTESDATQRDTNMTKRQNLPSKEQ